MSRLQEKYDEESFLVFKSSIFSIRSLLKVHQIGKNGDVSLAVIVDLKDFNDSLFGKISFFGQHLVGYPVTFFDSSQNSIEEKFLEKQKENPEYRFFKKVEKNYKVIVLAKIEENLERELLNKERTLKKIKSQVELAEKRLGNETFVKKAKKEVIEETKKIYSNLLNEIKKLTNEINKITDTLKK